MAAGCFGKVPAVGDFVRINLPADFVAAWDAWLADQLVAAAATLGAAWPKAYLTAPVWCFALTAGVAGVAPVRGLIVPSVDGVGRRFPLTLAEPLAGATPLGIRRETAWFAAAEDLARQALDAALPPARLRDGLAGLPPPPVPATGDRSPWLRLPLADDGRWRERIGRLADPLALFWTEGSPRVAPSLLACRALPEADRAAAMYDGDWERHGWSNG